MPATIRNRVSVGRKICCTLGRHGGCCRNCRCDGGDTEAFSNPHNSFGLNTEGQTEFFVEGAFQPPWVTWVIRLTSPHLP